MIERVRVTSDRDTDIKYVLTFVGDEPVSCTCPHFNFRADGGAFECKHMRRAANVLPLTKAQTILALEMLAANSGL
jgi:hypothetical protein